MQNKTSLLKKSKALVKVFNKNGRIVVYRQFECTVHNFTAELYKPYQAKKIFRAFSLGQIKHTTNPALVERYLKHKRIIRENFNKCPF